jgi:hypothetical protein
MADFDERKDYVDPERPDPDLRRPSPSAETGRKGRPPAGPHAKPALTNPEATPGAGALPRAGEDDDVDPASG